MDKALRALELEPLHSRKLSSLSQGQKKRVSVSTDPPEGEDPLPARRAHEQPRSRSREGSQGHAAQAEQEQDRALLLA